MRIKFHLNTISIIFSLLFISILSAATESNAAPTKEFVVVLDAGHGGHDHGAVDNGAREKDINLGVATKIAALIKKKLKNVKVVMTRDDDTFVSLEERANIANRNKGDLFISIHTNSVDKSNANRTKVSGASVYALGPQKDANNLRVAQRENSVIELESNYHQKYSGFDPSKDESYIIFEMAQKKTLGQSLKFAGKAQNELVKTAGRADRGVKQAGFWVLWATSMPAVLVELDFICNPASAEYLNSTDGQEQLANAIVNALKSYIDSNNNSVSIQTDEEPELKIKEPSIEIASKASISESADTQSVGLLKGIQNSTKNEKREHLSTTQNLRKSGVARKRRSSASRDLSDKQNFEAQNIRLTSETDYLIKQEIEEEKVETKLADNTVSEKNSKKKKNTKQKDKKVKRADAVTKESINSESSKLIAKAESKKKSNQKVYVVKNSGNTRLSASLQNTPKSATSSSPRPNYSATSVNSGQMTYQIQLISSDKELSTDDDAFCGIIPSGMFKENGQYKYTYGSSTNRKEIEKQLLDVKTIIPDAVIIVRNE